MPVRRVGVLFADVEGFSKLSTNDAVSFTVEFMEMLKSEVEAYRGDRRPGEDEDGDGLIDLNTWGDAIFATSYDVGLTAHLALTIRGSFLHPRRRRNSLIAQNKLRVRIALDYVEVRVVDNPLTGKPGCVGSELTRAARIEPVTPPNTVFVTPAFADALATMDEEDPTIVTVPFPWLLYLPKGAGKQKVLSLHLANEDAVARWRDQEDEKPVVKWGDPFREQEAVSPITLYSWFVKKEGRRYRGHPDHKPRHQKAETRLRECKEGEEVCFVSVTAKSIIWPKDPGSADTLVDVSAVAAAISEGVKIRGVVLDPDCEEARFRATIESGRVPGILQRHAGEIAVMPDSPEWSTLGDEALRNLVLKKTTVGLSLNLWLFSDWAIIEPYHFGKLEEAKKETHMCKFSQFIIPSTRDTEYGMLKAHFEVLWQYATPLWPDLQGDDAS